MMVYFYNSGDHEQNHGRMAAVLFEAVANICSDKWTLQRGHIDNMTFLSSLTEILFPTSVPHLNCSHMSACQYDDLPFFGGLFWLRTVYMIGEKPGMNIRAAALTF